MAEAIFPAAFAALEPYADWSLPSERERNAHRIASDLAAIQAFYDAAIEQMPAVIAHLQGRSVAALDGPDQRLFWLALSLMEVSPAIELFGMPDVPFAVPADRMSILSR